MLLRSLNFQFHISNWLAQSHSMLLACQALFGEHGWDRSKRRIMPLLLIIFLSNLPAVVFFVTTKYNRVISTTFRIASSFAWLTRQLLGRSFWWVVQDQTPTRSSKIVDVIYWFLDLALDLWKCSNWSYTENYLWIRAFLLGTVHHRLSLDCCVVQISIWVTWIHKTDCS